MALGTCRFCGKHTKLIEAHIVPRAFYPRVNDIRVLSINVPWAQRAPKGIYDPEILCEQCDGKFGVYESYAATVLRPRPRRADLYRGSDGFIVRGFDNRRMAYWIRQPDVRKLQAFGASLLWRAGVTTRLEMSIELDATTLDRARHAIDGDEASYFPIIGMRCEAGKLSEFVARPTLLSDEASAPGVQFYMNGIILSIFLAPPMIEQDVSSFLLLGQGEDWLIGFVPLHGSKYAETIMDICQHLKSNRPAAR